jgi:GNAT superfamily N-acetyltransferase
MEINIRKAVESDIDFMTLIYNDSIKNFPSNIRKESDYNDFKNIFNKSIVYIVEKSNIKKIIGWIAYEIYPEYTFIGGLYLLIDEQRKGIGTELLNYCIDTLKSENCKLIILNALKIAPWSIEFYRKNGFLIYDTTSEYGKDFNVLKTRTINNWELLMYKCL